MASTRSRSSSARARGTRSGSGWPRPSIMRPTPRRRCSSSTARPTRSCRARSRCACTRRSRRRASRPSCSCSRARRTPSRWSGGARPTSAPTWRWTSFSRASSGPRPPEPVSTAGAPVLRLAPMEAGRYRETEALFARALQVVPAGIYGHQTPAMLVPGAYPYFFARGQGAHVWDVDGNQYIDLMCSYGPIVLGHNHAKVDEVARRQAADGNCFNGPGRVWVELAEHLVRITPWAAWTVFAKNGSDVCTWALEVARAATGRRKVLAAKGAYHGTHAWCTPVATGTTAEDRAHVVGYRYNDLDSVDAALAAHDGDVAAIMVSPFRHDAFHDQEMPAPG